MLVATDYLDRQLVKCSQCGETYPVCIHGCPECGSTIITILWKDENNERSKSN